MASPSPHNSKNLRPGVSGGSRVLDDRDNNDHAIMHMEAENEAMSDDVRNGGGGCGESRYRFGCESRRVGNQGDSFERRVHDARVR
ncbi:acyl-activating enzyme 6 [Pyrus ussuriensis x Pyrus communis]|uniref:Acyl-activating enzyme 6 n=1 Tax=Pyrus ussuriensis x Pyrus communis TaxID=2448454 RepID=A0A5N5IA78_9ROSA|nr:acyl-activating enzyme 6 [Pyrus ussuriensis x Pyrus communis]